MSIFDNMNDKPKILIVDDDKSILTSFLILFRHHNFEPTIESDPKKIKVLLTENKFEAVVLDMNFRKGHNEGKEGIFWLEAIRRIQPNLDVVLITAYGDVDLAVEAVKKGAADFILKPWNNEMLIQKIRSVIELKRNANKGVEEKFVSKLQGISEASKQVISLVKKVSESPVSVLITGETGVGKKLVSNEIYQSYIGRKGTPERLDFDKDISMKEIDAKLSDQNLNTIVLSNIDKISPAIQIILNDIFENRKEMKIISICNHISLLSSFDASLLQKLSLIQLEVQPLRTRKEDVKELATYFLNEFSQRYGRKAISFSIESINKLNKHSWPGNVKELKHCIERAIILSEEKIISDDLIKIDTHANSSSINLSGTLNLSELERETIIKAIEECQGNITKASKKLGITRTALYRRMEKYDI